jgi:hypothetical protein
MKMILRIENTKLIYKKIKGQIKQKRNQDINKIQVLQNNGTIIEYTKTEEMAISVARYNETRYNQETNIPIAIHPETNPEEEKQHNIHNMEMKQIKEDFMKSIETTNTEQIDYKIDDKTRKTKITITSQSGVHPGDYKAAY